MEEVKEKKNAGRSVLKWLKNKKGFIWALAGLFAALFMAYICSAFGIHPITAANPDYHRTWIFFVLLMVLFFVLLAALAVHFFLHPISKKITFNMVMVGLVAIFGIVYMFVLPPLSAPDEIRHYLTAYKLSNQMMGKEAATEEGYVYMRAEDATLLLNDFPGQDDYYVFLNNWRNQPVDTTPTLFTEEKAQDNLAIAYVPQALGITLARLLGLRQIPLMMMGRLFNLIFFLVCFAAALKVMPFGKEILGLIALFPMTLEQISSMSYDAFAFALAFLYTAYVLYLAFSAPRVRKRDLALLTAIMAVLSPLKIIYIFLAFLMLIIPKEKFGNTRNYALSALFMGGIIIIVFLVLQMGTITEYVQGTDTHLEYADAEVYTLSWVFSHISDSAKIFFNTVRTESGYWFKQMIGSSLGWLEIGMPEFVPYLFTMLMMFAIARPADEPVYWKGWHRAIGFFVVAIICVLAIFAMFVAHTPEGYTTIQGVQGRYFLPVLPLAMLVVRGTSLKRAENTSPAIIYTVCLLNIWTVANVMAIIMSRMGEMRMTPAS